MNWDPFQREVLAELGHVLYRPANLVALLPAHPRPDDAAGAELAMLGRLARAAGVPSESLPSSLQEQAALARLRGDGAAKRALWPCLRALRIRPQ